MLTPKQQMFVKEFLVDCNGTQAAIRAGYSERTANEQAARLLAKASVKDAVNKAMQERSEITGITSNYVLETIQETIERCRQAKPVLNRKGEHVYVETAEGEIKPAYTFDSTAVLKGCELLGKHLKMFSDKLDVNHTGEIINVVERRVIKPSGDTPN